MLTECLSFGRLQLGSFFFVLAVLVVALVVAELSSFELLVRSVLVVKLLFDDDVELDDEFDIFVYFNQLSDELVRL